MKTLIITDSNCDLSPEYLDSCHIPVIPFYYILNGEEHVDDFGKTMSYPSFYKHLSLGGTSTTSQITPYTFEQVFTKYLDEGYDLIYIGFSSTLSQTFSNAMNAKNMILEEREDAKITLVDSMGATAGQGLLVYYASLMQKENKTYDEIVSWLEENKLKINIWFTVNDLEHLARGGRISSTSAAVGSMMQVKPLMIMNREGKLIPVKKVRGRKKALKKMVEEMKASIVSPEEQTIILNHGNCFDEATLLKEMILEEVGVKEVLIHYVGPVIGSHTGQGVLVFAYLGDIRP